MAWILLAAFCLVIWFFIYVTPRYIVDNSYIPNWEDYRCPEHRDKCRRGEWLIYLVFLFVSLPVLSKSFIVWLAGSEIIVRWLAYLIWTFDRRPDFAIGTHGIYGLSRLSYYHVPWTRVERVTLRRMRTVFGTMHALIINTKQESRRDVFMMFRQAPMVKFGLAPMHGFDVEEIVSLIEAYRPRIRILQEHLDMRPGWVQLLAEWWQRGWRK